MLDAQRRNGESSVGSGRRLAGFGPSLRLFVLLGVLAPLFVGLQYIVQESVPQIEVRFIPPDTQVAGSERVVERVVYVPVDKTETAPMSTTAAGLPQAVVSQATGRSADLPRQSGLDSANAVGATQVAAKEAPAEPPIEALAHADTPVRPAEEPMAHIGVVAVVTPVAAAPIAARRIAPASAVVVAPAAPVDEPEVAQADEPSSDEAVAEDDPFDVVAEQPAAPVEQVAEIQVVETMVDGSQSTRVVSYRIPVHDDAENGPGEAQAAAPAADEAADVREADAAGAADVADAGDAMNEGEIVDDDAGAAEPADDDGSGPDEDALSTVAAPTIWVMGQ